MVSADRRCASEDLVYREGKHGNALYVVTEGAVKLSGNSIFMFLLGPSDIFGHFLCAAREPVRRIHAEAFTGCQGVEVACKVIVISGPYTGRARRFLPEKRCLLSLPSPLTSLWGVSSSAEGQREGCCTPAVGLIRARGRSGGHPRTGRPWPVSRFTGRAVIAVGIGVERPCGRGAR